MKQTPKMYINGYTISHEEANNSTIQGKNNTNINSQERHKKGKE